MDDKQIIYVNLVISLCEYHKFESTQIDLFLEDTWTYFLIYFGSAHMDVFKKLKISFLTTI